jgi:hypothetical protein
MNDVADSQDLQKRFSRILALFLQFCLEPDLAELAHRIACISSHHRYVNNDGFRAATDATRTENFAAVHNAGRSSQTIKLKHIFRVLSALLAE